MCRFYPGLSPVDFPKLKLRDVARLATYMDDYHLEQERLLALEKARATADAKIGALSGRR